MHTKEYLPKLVANEMSNEKDQIIIVGAGLVGPLCACFFAKKKFEVHLYEKREVPNFKNNGSVRVTYINKYIRACCDTIHLIQSADVRKNVSQTGKSINLALSNRARKALRIIGLEDEVLASAVPMRGRFIHELSGYNHFLPYDAVHNQCLYSVNRNNLNALLLTAAEKRFNVNTYFEHDLIEVDLKEGAAYFKNLQTQEIIKKQGELIVGADGAHSSLRRALQHQQILSFTQKYIEHGYAELIIKPTEGKRMRPNALHIWPRRTLMLIALPNSDDSWTVTLFMPFRIFDELKDTNSYLKFFENNFPDAVDLLGAEQIAREMPSKKARPLISVFCEPYHFANKFLLIGDAAHAMVPFYGQGMNAGFEDCTILNRLLDLYENDFSKIIKEFTVSRKEDAHAICELAIYNYKEMRNLTLKKTFRARKAIDEFLYTHFPNLWIPLYISVTFSDMRYKKCMDNKIWQDQVIQTLIGIAAFFALILIWQCYY